MYTLALLNQKGGVGKTVLTKNLGAALAEMGYRVLLVDLDPQGHLTEACGLPETAPPHTLAEAMLSDTATLSTERVSALVQSWQPGIDLIATNTDMFLLERQLYRGRAPEYRFQRVVELLEKADQWDACLIDCPPSLGVLTDNALVAAGQVLIPVQSEDSALRALRLLLQQVATMKAELRTDVDLIGMVVNLYDRRKGQIVTSTLDTLKAMPLDILAVINDRAAIREAWRAGVPVVKHAPTSDSAQAFRDLAKQLIEAGSETVEVAA